MYIKQKQDIKESTKVISASIEQYFDGINGMKQIVENIGSIWQGEDYKNFQIKMEEFANDLRQLGNVLKNNTKFLENYQNASDALEINYEKRKIDLK